MVHGTDQVIPILSTPEGAAVAIDGVPMGSTPILATLSRGRSHVATVSRDSSPPINVEFHHRVSGWVWGNVFIYYLPALIDFANGAAFTFDTDTVRVVFPGQVANGDVLRFGFAGLDHIRFVTSTSDQSFVYARVDSSTADQLYVHSAPDALSRRYDSAAVVRLADVRRLDVNVGTDGAKSGAAGAHYASIVSWGLPTVLGAVTGQPGLGLAIGALYTVTLAPIGYGLGAAVAPERWAPWEAHRIGSPLLVDDRLRIRLVGSERGISGRLVTIDSSDIFMTVGQDTTRLRRSMIASMRRHDSYDFGTGAKRGLAIGAIIGALTGAQIKGSVVNPNGPNLMLGAGIGAVVGLFGTTALAPRKWVAVRKW
jgi:hypothetical protein